MELGNWGPLVFETSDRRILSFPSLSHTASAQIDKHEVGGSAPIVEFIGPGDETVSFELLLMRQLGVDPLVEIEKIRSAMAAGQRYPLIIGGKPKGGAGALWMVADFTDITETDGRGTVVRATVSVNMTLAPNPPVIVSTAGKVAKSNTARRRITQ